MVKENLFFYFLEYFLLGVFILELELEYLEWGDFGKFFRDFFNFLVLLFDIFFRFFFVLEELFRFWLGEEGMEFCMFGDCLDKVKFIKKVVLVNSLDNFI